MTRELHRPLSVDRVGRAGLYLLVEASPDECAALARRMNLPTVQSLTCRFHLAQERAETLVAHGHLLARFVQTCIISLEDFSATVDEHFAIRFVVAGTESDDPDPEAPDEIPYVDGVIDFGEVAAEQLALSLDAYPRAPGAVLPEVEVEEVSHQFASLAALNRRH